MQVVFTVNGPGEISGWLHPLSAELRARHPGIRICACVVPCVFSTGAEAEVIRALGTVDDVLGVSETLALLLLGRRPPGVRLAGPTLVFHLGGDLALSHLLGLRLGAPRYGYVEHPAALDRLFRKVFYNGLSPRQGEGAGGTVGELMVDAARLRRAAADRGGASGGPCVAIFPGSRPYLATHVLPYFAVLVDRLSARRPDIDWVLARADYLPMATLRQLPPPPADRSWEAAELSFGEDAGGAWLMTGGGRRIRIIDGRTALARADFALTVPGTNTGELAASGVPMVVGLPTYMAHAAPLPGLAGHVGRLPVVGRALKGLLGRMRLRKLGLLAQPNVRAGEMIVPEFVGQGLLPAMEAALDALLDGFGRDEALRARLRATMGPAGAARALADEIGAFFDGCALPPPRGAAA
jgi:lipid-A-disaccharide synthase